MSRAQNVAVPLILLLSALAFSGCATKPKEAPVAEPAPVEVVAEQPSAPEPEAVAEPAPFVVAEQPAVSAEPVPQVVPKARKKVVKRSQPKAAPPAPVAAPVPVAAPEVPAVQPPEPAPPVTVAPPVQEVAEPGFFEEYWLWLLGLGIVIAGIVAWWWKDQEGKR